MQKQIYMHFAESKHLRQPPPPKKQRQTQQKSEIAGANTTGIRFYPGEVKDSESREKTGTCSLFSEAHPI